MNEVTLRNRQFMKMNPRQRFPEFKGEWIKETLGNIVEFKNGKAHEQDIDENGEYIVVNSRFISTEGQIRKYSSQLICPLRKSEIVMVMSDIPRGKALAKCFFIDQAKTYTLNQRICGLYSKIYSNKFLFYRINRNRYFLKFDSGVGQTNLRKNEVLNCPIYIPVQLPEQQKIAAFLSAVDEKIRLLTRKKELLEQYKKGVMQKIFSREIRFKDENGKDYPDWEERKLGELARRTTTKNKNNEISFVLTNSAIEGIVSQRHC